MSIPAVVTALQGSRSDVNKAPVVYLHLNVAPTPAGEECIGVEAWCFGR